MENDNCLECQKVVTAREHAITCDKCDRWQHRKCNTGIDYKTYLAARKNKAPLQFICKGCELSIPMLEVEESEDDYIEMVDASVAVNFSDSNEESDDTEETTMDTEISEIPRNSARQSLILPSIEGPLESTRYSAFGEGLACQSFIGDIETRRDETLTLQENSNSSIQETRRDETLQENSNASIQEPSVNLDFNISNRQLTITEEILNESLPDRSMSDTLLEEEDEQYEIVSGGTKRGGQKLISSKGFSYTFKRKTNRKTTWVCSIRNRTTTCRASVDQCPQGFVQYGQHVHQPDPGICKKVKLATKVKQDAAGDIFRPAQEIVEKNWQDLVTEQDFNLMKPSNLKRYANRFRQSTRPKEPSPTDVIFEINRDYLQLEDFIRAEVNVDNQRHIILASERQLELLTSSRRWFMDGTFKIVRKPFQQMWSIHTFVHKGENIKQVPLVFVLMTRKSTEDYVGVLNKIKDIAGDVHVVAGTLDFEAGCWTALRRVFQQIQLHGCVFHWVQCIWRKVQEYGLQATYNKRQATYDYIRHLMALPFLPHQHMRSAFDILYVKATTPELQRLVDYMKHTWFESSIFPLSSLSVFNMAIRTNNDCEGWHRRLNKRSNGNGLGFYVLVPFLKNEADYVTCQVRLVQDEMYSRNTRSLYCKLQKRLNSLWQNYKDGVLSTSELLKNTAVLYGDL